MSITVAPSTSFEASIDVGTTGLVGTIAIGIYEGSTDVAHTALATTTINEIGTTGLYVATRTSPAVAGQYLIVWSLDGSLTPAQLATEDLLITSSSVATAAPAGRDLCTLAEVKTYIPGYVTDTDTDTLLQRFINAESTTILNRGREFVVIGTNPQARSFYLNSYDVDTRTLPVGDLATTPTTVAVTTIDGTAVQTVAAASIIGKPYLRQAWDPITDLVFPAGALDPATLSDGNVITVTGTYGFPSIPPDVREACCKMVVVRYLTDVARAGTDLSDAVDNLNIGGLLTSAREALDQYYAPLLA